MKRGSAASRLAAVALLVIAVVALVAGVFVPLTQALRDRGERIDTLRADIARFERIAARRTGLEAALADDPTRRTLETWLRPEAGAQLAAAAMQARVGQLVDSSGGRVTSTRVMPPRRGEDLTGGAERVVLNLRLSLGTEALQQLLYSLESELPLMLVDELQVRTRRRRRSRQQGAPQPTELDVQLVLVAFVASGTRT